MIPNTFKPYFNWIIRTSGTHDYISMGFEVCNRIGFHISIWGYGFFIGLCFFDVVKDLEKRKKKKSIMINNLKTYGIPDDIITSTPAPIKSKDETPEQMI